MNPLIILSGMNFSGYVYDPLDHLLALYIGTGGVRDVAGGPVLDVAGDLDQRPVGHLANGPHLVRVVPRARGGVRDRLRALDDEAIDAVEGPERPLHPPLVPVEGLLRRRGEEEEKY